MDLYKTYEHFCNACNHVNTDEYNTFIINITQTYKLAKKKNRI